MADQTQAAEEKRSMNRPAPELLDALRARLQEVGEPERYELFSQLFEQLALWQRSGAGGRRDDLDELLDPLNKKVKLLAEEKATLQDTVAQSKADLAHQARQLEAEQARSAELQKIIDEQRARLEAATKQTGDLEAELVSKNSQLHKTEIEVENLQLKFGRAEFAATDTSKVDRLAEDNRQLVATVESVRSEMERLRLDKSTDIERIKAELLSANEEASKGAQVTLGDLWQRLASAKQPLVTEPVEPTVQAAERLFDALIELAGFADNLEQDVRPFLDRYTKYNEKVKRPWNAYRRHEQLYKAIQSTIAVKGGKPVGVLKMRLWGMKAWTYAALLASDSAIECIASELQGHLMGPLGAGSNPNCRVRDYVKSDGHMLFAEHIKELRSDKLSDAYGLGS